MIVVKLMGGLGNQMFQYASALALSKRHGVPLRLDLSFLEDRTPRERFTYRSYALDAFGIDERLNTADLLDSRPTLRYQEPNFYYDPNFAGLPDHCYLDGYFQSEKYFLDQSQTIRETFSKTPMLNSYSEAMLASIAKSAQPVALHIRRGDYVTTHSQTHPVCSLSYYSSALDCMQERLGSFDLFIFSDDPEWASNAIHFSGINTTLVNCHLSSGECADLYLMSKCQHHIIANSSFSWWGAWLGAHANQMVIAPKRWFANQEMNEATFDLCPGHWIRLGESLPQISVVMPVRNGEVHLEEAIESILSQTFSDFEFLVIDDASTDSTPRLLELYRRKDMRLRVLRNQEWKSIAPSLNYGLAQAISPLIARMDADDFAEPKRLEIQHAFMKEHPEISVCGSYYRFYSNGQVQQVPTDDESIRREMLFRNPMGHPTVLMRRELLKRLGGYDLDAPFIEDYALWARLSLEKNAIFANIPIPLLRYRFDFAPSPERDSKRRQVQDQANLIAQKVRAQQTSDRLLAHARSCLSLQQPERAQLLAELVLQRNTASPDALAILTESLWYQGRKEETLAQLSNLVGQHPDFKPGILLAMAITRRIGEHALSARIGAAYARRHPEDAQCQGWDSPATPAPEATLSPPERNATARDEWLRQALGAIPAGSRLLDAGAGEKAKQKYCTHLRYVAQDFGKYEGTGNGKGLQTGGWNQSELDIVCDITAIPEPDASFDAILCCEVFEHLPDPLRALKELSRLLRTGGELILTAPFGAYTHFAPYFYSTGFSRYWYEKHLPEQGLLIEELTINGNFPALLQQEVQRVPYIAERYCGMALDQKDRQTLRDMSQLLEKLYAKDQGSGEFACFGLHIRARKLSIN